MKIIAFIALLIASSLCIAQQPGTPQPASAATPEGRVRILNIVVGTFECRTKADGAKRDCKAIPVIILRNGADYIAQLPYHDFQVRTEGTQQDVTWKLIGPPRYKFASNGIDITSDDPQKPIDDVWKNPTLVSDDVYRWTLKKNAPQRDFGHVANVLDPSGTPCKAGDPAIHNDAN